MKRIAATAALSFLAASAALAQDVKMDWRHDYRAAQEEAKKKQKYLVLHFTGSN